MDETKVVEALIELKTEVKYIWKTLGKVEKVLENQAVFEEKQNVANKRIAKLEDYHDKQEEKTTEKITKVETRMRKIEDWQIKAVTIATLLATGIWFILNKVF